MPKVPAFITTLCRPGPLDQLGQTNIRSVELVASDKDQDSGTAESPNTELVAQNTGLAWVEIIGDHGIKANVCVNGNDNTQETICDGVGTLEGRGSEEWDHRNGQQALKVPVVGSVKLVGIDGLVRNSLVDIGHI